MGRWMVLRETARNTRTLLLLVAVSVALLISNVWTSRVAAANLLSRSLTLGTSVPAATTTHTIGFQTATADVLGSIEFEYCSNDPFIGTACTPPVGLDLSAAVMAAQTGATGFSIHGGSTSNKLILTRTPIVAVAGPVEYVLSNVVNPQAPSSSTYVRISTFASDNATGSRTDSGALVFSTSGGLGIGAYVPPFLIFCVGVTVGPNCSSTIGERVSFGELVPFSTATATTQFAAATNDPTGYNVYANGTTLTSGNDVIAASSSPTFSTTGNNQFGINLRANTAPVVGNERLGSGTAIPKPNYINSNQFMFSPGDALAGATQATEMNIFTVAYIVNRNASQAPGNYSTTMTYVAVAQF